MRATKILVGGIVLASLVAVWAGPVRGGKIGRPLHALGISSFECQCSQTISGDRQFWVFHSEPRINKVDRDGPAHGKLKGGDYIVAIDGKLITTRAAGSRFGRIEAGDEVVLTVRRGDRTFDRTIVAREPKDDDVVVDDLDETRTGIVRLSESVELLSKLAAGLVERETEDDELDEPGFLLDLSDLEDMLADLEYDADISLQDATLRLGEIKRITPRGSFGFGLSFSGSIRQRDGEPDWEFDAPPKIRSVDPGSPADLAGIEKGDVLTHIDGVRLTSREGGERFSSVEPGQTVEWTYKRGRKSRTTEMTAVERPERYDRRSARSDVRYKGELGTTTIEVRGPRAGRITVSEEDGKIIIKTRDGVIELKQSHDDDE